MKYYINNFQAHYDCNASVYKRGHIGTLGSSRLLTITNCIINLLTEYETPLHGLDSKSNE